MRQSAIRTWGSAALLACIVPLAGCATTPAVQVRTVTVQVPVQVPIAPELLLQQPMPTWSAPYTWGSLAQYTIRLQTAALECHAQVQAIALSQHPPLQPQL